MPSGIYPNNKGHIAWNKGRKTGNKLLGKHWNLTKEQNDAKSKRMKGKMPKNIYSLRNLSPEQEKQRRIKIGLSNSISKKGKPSGAKGKHWKIKDTSKMGAKGEKHYNWQGGISTENDKLRHNKSINIWKKACLERDNFICQKTKISGGELQVHHINNFVEFPELRTSIDNGITLSKKSHIEFHKIYGFKNNTQEQLTEFLNQNY